MTTTVATEKPASTSTESKPASPTTADMAAFLRSDEGAEGQPKEPGQDNDGDVEKPAPHEAKDAEPEKDDEAKAEEEDEKGKDGKPSRWQRLKAKSAQHEASAKAAREEAAKAVRLANEWHIEAQQLRQEMEALKAKAQAVGLQDDPRDNEVALLRRQELQRQVAMQFEAQQRQQEVEQQIVAQKDALREEFSTSAERLSAKHGISAAALLKTYAFALESSTVTGEEPTLDEVAATLANIEAVRKAKSQHSAAQAQLTTSRSAPRTIEPSGTSADRYPATPEGMKAFLLASRGG